MKYPTRGLTQRSYFRTIILLIVALTDRIPIVNLNYTMGVPALSYECSGLLLAKVFDPREKGVLAIVHKFLT